MSDYDNTDTGALFKNKNKTGDKHPDYKGTINVDGVDYDIAAWLSEIKRGERAGEKFMKLKISEPYQRSDDRDSRPAAPNGIDDEIPF